VKSAVESFLVNPALILEPLRQLNKSAELDAKQYMRVAEEAAQELARLHKEEQRVLDAYRSGVISPAQLGEQLEKVNTQRNAMEVKKGEVERNPVVPAEHVEKSITEYCSEAALNITKFTTEEWRTLLRTVIHSITFDGDRITISGRLPIPEYCNQSNIVLRDHLQSGQ